MINLRGHHLRLLNGYVRLLRTKNPECKTRRVMNKDDTIIYTAIVDGHSKEHGINIVNTMHKILEGAEKIKMTDTLDDICADCNSQNERRCREFIPYDVSSACEDRATLHFYGLNVLMRII